MLCERHTFNMYICKSQILIVLVLIESYAYNYRMGERNVSSASSYSVVVCVCVCVALQSRTYTHARTHASTLNYAQACWCCCLCSTRTHVSVCVCIHHSGWLLFRFLGDFIARDAFIFLLWSHTSILIYCVLLVWSSVCFLHGYYTNYGYFVCICFHGSDCVCLQSGPHTHLTILVSCCSSPPSVLVSM